MIKRTALLGMLCGLLLVPDLASAHCRFTHPHHCVENLGKRIFGGVKKRARMIWDDPLGVGINPIKVIDESIPTPLSFVEYAIKNPDEIVEIVQNPTAGVVGAPLALLIADSRNAALKNGTSPIPPDVRTYMEPLFDKDLLDSVRYTTDSDLWDGLAQFIALHTVADAVTLVNVIVFKDETGANSPDNVSLWAHELFHVRQYEDMGLLPFAATMTLSPGTGGNIERPAYRFDQFFSWRYDDRSGSRFDGTRTVSADLLVGLSDKCMAATGSTVRSPIVLRTCDANDRLQQWRLTRSGELRTPDNLCADVRGGVDANRTPLQLFDCNRTKAQIFDYTRRGEFRSALRDDLCVEVAGGNTANGTPIQVFDCNRTASQFWKRPLTLLLATSNQLGSSIIGLGSKCMAASGTSLRTPVVLQTCNPLSPGQQWRLTATGELRTPQDLCLDVQGGRTANRTPLHLFDCNRTASQKFRFTADDNLLSALKDGLCVEAAGGNTADGTAVQVFECNGTLSQEWNISANERCLRADGQNLRDAVRLTECDKADQNQHWALDDNVGELNLISAPDRCLDVSGGQSANRTPLQIFDCNGTKSQIFDFTRKFEIRSQIKNNKCVEVPGGNFAGSDPLQIFDCNGTASQLWNPL
jgi:hypothetical protein